jgi:septal ring factor EnvC (AmiA/AmiB activator)
MEPENLTVRLLQEIRDEVRHSSEKSEVRFEKMDQRFEKMDQRFEKMDQRAEVVETTLRDLAQQMVMLARGIKTALEHRSSVDNRLDDAERRLNDLEKRVGH